MTRGRKPHSTARKKLEGNPGKRKLNKNEPVLAEATDEFDEPPIELMDDEIASAEWRRIVPMLRKSKMVSTGERGLLISLCVQWSRYVEANNDIRERGLVIDIPKDAEEQPGGVIVKYVYPMQNPNLSIANKALSFCIKLWSELGLTPSSRSRVHPIGAKEGDSDGFGEFN